MATEQNDDKKVVPKAPQKPVRVAADEHAPYKPPTYEPMHAAALQALAKGLASAHQQKIALDWIIQRACALYDEPFRPGAEEGRRNTDFALGRAFPGRQIVKLININLSNLRGGKDGEQP